MTPAIEIRRLRKTFAEVVAVDDIDLVVESGMFFGFLGPNGAGKSTTIKMLTGQLIPSAGSARIMNRDIVHKPIEAKRQIGVVPETSALFDRLTAIQQLRFVGRMYGMDRAVIDARARELLALMDLEDERSKLIVDFSHGMRKKLAICAAVIHEPKVLFLDEPFEGIDAISSRLVRSVLNQLVASGVTIFLTSHVLEVVEKLCSDVAIIHEGQLVAAGPLDELRKGGVDARGDASQVGLEDLFISLVGGVSPKEARLSWLD